MKPYALLLFIGTALAESPVPLVPDALRAAYWKADAERKAATIEKQAAASREAEAEARFVSATQALIKFCAEQDATASLDPKTLEPVCVERPKEAKQ